MDNEVTKPRVPAWKPLLLIAIVAALFVAAIYFDLGERLRQTRDWIETLGHWGPVAFIALYVAATIAMVPGTALALAAGGLFGAAWGTAYVSIASTTGAALCFLIARYVARKPVAAWLGGKPLFQKLDRLAERRGAWVVAITRLVPLFPFNLLNYGFGLTGVRFWTYLFFSWLCMLPGTILYVAGSDAITKGIREGRVPWALVGIVTGAFALLVVLVAFAKRKLKDGDAPRRIE